MLNFEVILLVKILLTFLSLLFSVSSFKFLLFLWPFNISSTVTSYNVATSVIILISGNPRPLSHLEIVLGDSISLVATSS